jgi:hydrogenase expression/formation protein HypC
MCLAVPAEVLSIQGEMATCRVDRGQTTIKASLMLLPEPPDPGEFLIIHAGFALRILDRRQAEESLRLLNGAACGDACANAKE